MTFNQVQEQNEPDICVFGKRYDRGTAFFVEGHMTGKTRMEGWSCDIAGMYGWSSTLHLGLIDDHNALMSKLSHDRIYFSS